jgi:hypothetical protein
VAIDERLTWSEYMDHMARCIYSAVPHAEGRPAFDKLDKRTRERWLRAAEDIWDWCQTD